MTAADVHDLLGRVPSLVVLDGLDEVGMGAWSHTWLDPGAGKTSPREIGKMFGEVLISRLRA